MVLLLISLISLNLFALTPAEEECKKRLETAMYKKGLMTNKVCLDDSHYPNISIQTSLENFKLGDKSKNVDEQSLQAMAKLSKLLNRTAALGGGKKEIIGFTDGYPAAFTQYDDLFFKSGSKAKNNKITKEFREDIEDYINKIEDEESKKIALSLYKSIKNQNKNSVEFKCDNNVCDRQSIADNSEQSKLADILRNHALSIGRAEDFCTQLGSQLNSEEEKQSCLANKKGVTSPNLILNRGNLNPKGRQDGVCDYRRGIVYNFYLPDSIVEIPEYQPGKYEPSFKIAERKWQDKMHLASSLEMMKSVSENPKFAEFKSTDPNKLLSDANFWDIEKDQNRFKELYKNTGCEKSDYLIDATRRKYWNIAHEMAKTHKMFDDYDSQISEKKDNLNYQFLNKYQQTKVNSYKSLLEKIEKADYTILNNDPEFIKLFEMSTAPGIAQTSDYFEQINEKCGKTNQVTNIKSTTDNSKNTENELRPEVCKHNPQDWNQFDRRMIALVRTMVLGRSANVTHKVSDPSIHPSKSTKPKSVDPEGVWPFVYSVSASDQINQKDLIDEGKLGADVSVYKEMGVKVPKNIISKYSKANNNIYTRYPNAEIEQFQDNNYTSSDVHNCNSSIDALADFASNGADDSNLMSLKNEDSFSMDHKKVMQKEVSSDTANIIPKHLVKEGKVTGWVCQECGSGLHIHEDGFVENISRQRLTGQKVDPNASNSFHHSSDIPFGLGSLEHLKVYSVPNCKDCGCLKNKTGEELSKLLLGNEHPMITMENNKPYLKNNEFKINSDDTCVFVPPVPHSCSFDPVGESKEVNQARENRKNLYCHLEAELKADQKNFPDIKDDNLADFESINKLCKERVGKFPQSEMACGYNPDLVKKTENQNSSSSAIGD